MRQIPDVLLQNNLDDCNGFVFSIPCGQRDLITGTRCHTSQGFTVLGITGGIQIAPLIIGARRAKADQSAALHLYVQNTSFARLHDPV